MGLQGVISPMNGMSCLVEAAVPRPFGEDTARRRTAVQQSVDQARSPHQTLGLPMP